jgi:hypothetical protein
MHTFSRVFYNFDVFFENGRPRIQTSDFALTSWIIGFEVFDHLFVHLKREADSCGPVHGVAKSQEHTADACGVLTVKFR